MHGLFYKIFQNIGKIFSGKNLRWHVLAIILTWMILESGFDWWYFVATRNLSFYALLYPAAILGALVPFILPVCMVVIGFMRKDRILRTRAWAIGQAAILASLISSIYKFFTGRVQPTLYNVSVDSSHSFGFGFGTHGIFWGWPSSHATIAFAMAVTLIYLYPKNRKVTYIALIYALYVGLGMATLGFHWFSEFVAGAIIGSVIGVVVGKAFRSNLDAGRPSGPEIF